MSDVENILNNDQFFSEKTDTPKEGVEQDRKQQCLKGVISKREVYSLGDKKQWTHESADKAKDKTINKVYAEHKQCEKRENTGKVLGTDLISLYSCVIYQVFKIKDVKKFH